MRILWVFDVVQDVQKIVDDSQKAHTTPGNPGTTPVAPGTNTGNHNVPSNMPLDQNVVQSYTIQV